MAGSFPRGLTLLTTLLLVATGGCCAPSGGRNADTNAARPPNVLACRLANYGKFQDAAWSHLPSLGIQYVFINVPPPEEVAATTKRLRDHGLTAVVMRGDADLSKPSCVDVLDAQLATCKKMGAEFMFLSAKRRGADPAVVYDRLRKAGDAAKKHGVTIVLETHPDLATNGEVALETMKQINHPNVRMNFDTGNIHYYNANTDAATELKKIIDYVATVEVKDHKGGLKVWNFPALGQGNVDIPQVLEILETHGYTGPLTMELEGVKGVEKSKAETLEYIAESVRYMRSLAQFK